MSRYFVSIILLFCLLFFLMSKITSIIHSFLLTHSYCKNIVHVSPIALFILSYLSKSSVVVSCMYFISLFKGPYICLLVSVLRTFLIYVSFVFETFRLTSKLYTTKLCLNWMSAPYIFLWIFNCIPKYFWYHDEVNLIFHNVIN